MPAISFQEVPGMGFHITQPGSSVATSLIDGESKPKHVLLLEIKVVFVKMFLHVCMEAAMYLDLRVLNHGSSYT